MSAALPFPHSRQLPSLTYCHQPPQHPPRRQTHRSAGGRCFSHRGFAILSQARQSVVPESCSFLLSFLRSVRFHSLLPTPPRGDAVTSSSQPGCVRSWLESPTPEGVGALRRTRGVSPSACTSGVLRSWCLSGGRRHAAPYQRFLRRSLGRRRKQRLHFRILIRRERRLCLRLCPLRSRSERLHFQSYFLHSHLREGFDFLVPPSPLRSGWRAERRRSQKKNRNPHLAGSG